VVDGRTGVFFDEQSQDSLIDAIARLERMDIDSADIVLHARQFNPARFERQMRDAIADAWAASYGQEPPAAATSGEGGKVLLKRRRPAYG